MTLKNKTYLNSQLYLAGLPVILLCPASTFWKLETLKGDGEYWINPKENGSSLKVFCDMTTDGGKHCK